ncbi:Uncharacterised protein [Mycobacterium tuberculosis]|uniref:Uncharacterized protein n=1 Tax=Mycobacterium tuberculosis TaxID=1773 RepID=A0A654ZII8_MYCTX|nr:Uncharacterised protein [Mycobacterium tuberculosis]CKS97705.1 Uncharacterised protein [Mycobacterium tuberculosis]CNW17056.1 Uncharacterised protein [Mycobacterium tuberculosis]CNZ82317.1 Uncharacterised protein [Mycobacterium tuberculosis]CNZ91254.1 Uncharacterised protein [Mycobacterium tuberculosis]
MSLVSTASDSSPRNCRHSAATSAVLPEPTGPPTPMRSGSPGLRTRLGRAGTVCEWGWECVAMPYLSGNEQGTHALVMPLGERVQQRIRQVCQSGCGLLRDLLAQFGQLEGHHGHFGGI